MKKEWGVVFKGVLFPVSRVVTGFASKQEANEWRKAHTTKYALHATVEEVERIETKVEKAR